MRLCLPCTAIGLAIVAAAPAANAQTVITRQIVGRPVETVRTTTTTVRTIRPATRRIVTRRTVVSHRVLPAAPAAVAVRAPVVATTTYPAAPLYDVVGPAPVEDDSYYSQPVYDTVVTPVPAPPPRVVTTAPLYDQATMPAAPVGVAVPLYRYVYQPDRILVIDPNTGIAVQALQR